MSEDLETASETHSLIVTPAQAGERLDRFLSESIDELSRSRVKALLQQGAVTVNGEVTSNVSLKVPLDGVIEIEVPEPEDLVVEAEEIPLDIVFEDPHLIVINKPSGMVVHPGAGNRTGTLVNALLHHCGDSLVGIGGVRRPGIVHRIDKETSGLLVVAKDQPCHEGLVERFAAHDIDRRYNALVYGLPNPVADRLEGDIGRDPNDRKRMKVVKNGKGRHAVTHYKVEKRWGNAVSLIECRLETGRTHQIRVHMTKAGHPLIGDKTYGRLSNARLGAFPPALRPMISAFPRQALHARTLGFDHPVTGKNLNFEAELPGDLKTLIKAFDKAGEAGTDNS